MARTKLLLALLPAVALSGCCTLEDYCGSPKGAALASWDGLGSPWHATKAGHRPSRNGKPLTAGVEPKNKEAPPNPYSKYSQQWWDFQEAQEREEEKRLTQVLTICRGCLQPGDVTTPSTIAENPPNAVAIKGYNLASRPRVPAARAQLREEPGSSPDR